MLLKLQLVNFLPHRNTTLEFGSGVNFLLGDNASGKSSIMNAFDWLWNNQPAGDSMRNWKAKAKGEDTVVTGWFQNPDGVHEVSRVLGNSKNMYVLDGKELKALGKGGVPDEVRAVINVTELNCQSQMDAHFLIGNKNKGETARLINEIAKLDEMDNAQGAVSSLIRQNSTMLATHRLAEQELATLLEQYANLDKLQDMQVEAEELELQILVLDRNISDLNKATTSLSTARQEVKRWEHLGDIEVPSTAEYDQVDSEVYKLVMYITTLAKTRDGIAWNERFGNATCLLAGVNTLLAEYDDVNASITALEDLRVKWHNAEFSMKGTQQEIDDANAMLVELRKKMTVCSECGRPL